MEPNHQFTFRLPRRIFVGSIVTPQSLTKLRYIKRGIIGVGTAGVIRFVEDLEEIEAKLEKSGKTSHISQHLDEDRSATPVNVPRHKPDHSSHESESALITSDEMTLPPPALGDGYTPEENKKEQEAIEYIAQKHGWKLQDCETVLLGSNSFLSPGFVDTHVHAPQVPNLGRGQQYELLDWLENITFPRERKFEDPLYARKTYESVVQRMLDCGTTCAAIYATLHEEATMILAQICNDKGMRAFVGKCQMDRNAPVEYKEKTSSASMESTKRFINFCRSMPPYGMPKSPETDPINSSGSVEMDQSIARLSATMNGILQGEDVQVRSPEALRPNGPASNADSSSMSGRSDSSTRATSIALRSVASSVQSHGHSSRTSVTTSGAGTPKRMENANALVQPILTPRFAIACSDALLASISALMSRDPSLRVQTHLSENPGEIAFTKELFPFCETYTDVYDHFSLLTPRTILAHAIHLDEQEMKLIAERKCGISHCPTSNLNLRSGASRLGELLNRGIKVGLGTDMSGGFGMSMLSAIRDASVVAKVIQFTPSSTEKPKFEQTKDQHDFCKGPMPLATLFYLATLGGAEVCNIAHRVGSLDVGKEFDAILFNCDNTNPNLYIEDDDGLEEKLEKVLFCGDDRNIASVFVRGRVVGGSAPIA
ncbi:uncharacterized protein FA14DRAFT_117778 [Meira miltonrushii]|uniref:Amidohydrolase-related domain-containing protein n=1 Tax=Meira miltonrushii TaxID=1280837 RepID=A0A316VFZ0_9BASI|nr:uncharacterized protein FA14DRAFT_117778 [Meira miltonrushii]PWN36547.1 hypothetical protein FA14DRAFT_117778 [Meira miltonrushii]